MNGLQKLCIGTVSGLALLQQAAQAQETSVDQTDQEAGVQRLAPVLVTGERVERDVQDTASSVVVFNNDRIDTLADGSDVNDVLSLSANVVQGVGQETPVIRGQNSAGSLTGTAALFGGARARATYVVDGRAVDLIELTYGASSVWDLDRIEVFRGPQTTTQGLNSIAGAVFVETSPPEYQLEGRARAVAGEFDTQQYSGMINLPVVSDQVALRVSADYRTEEADATFVPQLSDQNDVGVSDALNIRTKALFEPNAIPGLRSVLTYNRIESNGPQAVNTSGDLRSNINPNFAHWDVESDIAIADIDYDIGNGFSISGLFSMTDSTIERRVAPGTGGANIDTELWSAETLIEYNNGGALSAVFGAYFADRDEVQFLDIGPGADISGDTSTQAVFGEVQLAVSDKLTFIGGARYQQDEITRLAEGFGTTLVSFDESYDVFLPKATIKYDFSDDVSFGFTAAKGYTPGGATINTELFIPDLFEEESLWSYELFYRSYLLDRSVRLNANLFVTDFEDTQRSYSFAVGGNPNFLTSLIANAESAQSLGAELEVQWLAADNLDVIFGLGFLDTELEEFSELAQTPFLLGDPIGNEFQRAPNLTANMVVDWRPNDAWNVNVQARYADKYFSDDLNTPAQVVDALFTADARVSYAFASAELFVFASNIFDERQFVLNFGELGGASTGLPNEPRKLGLGVDISF